MKKKGMFMWAKSIVISFFLLVLVFSNMINNIESPLNDEIIEVDVQVQEPDTPFARGTRAVESYDWPMFHQNVHMTGVADPSVSAPDNVTAYIFDSGGDIESTPAVVDNWVYFGQSTAPSGDYSFYGLNETDGWYWKYNSTENWAWRGSPAVADIPGVGNMVFIGQSSGNNNRFYGFDADPDDNNDGVIDGLDNDEGQVDAPGAEYDIIWTIQFTAGFYRHSPLVADIPALGGNVIYMGQTDGNVTCIRASDGAILWNWNDPTDEGFQYSHPTLGYDVLGNPMLFIINDGGGVQNTIYALDAVGSLGTTTIRWQSNVHGQTTRGGPAVEIGGPGANDDRVYFVSFQWDPTLYCFDATPDDNGNFIVGDIGDDDEGVPDLPGSQYDLIWSYQLGSDTYAASTPALNNGKVYVGMGGSGAGENVLFAVAQNTTQPQTHVIWTYDAPGDIYWNSPIVADGKVIVTTRGWWGIPGLAVLNEIDGSLIWFNSDEFGGTVETSCSIANGRIYVGGDDNKLHVFGPAGKINKKPHPPELYSPINDDIVITSTPRFDWSDAIDIDGFITSYEIEIDDNSDFSSPEYFASGLSPSHYFPSFIADGTYFWRVRSVDNDSAHSIWSVVWIVTIDTINDYPEIDLISPNGGEVWAGVHGIFWSASDPEREPLIFDVWLSDNSGVTYDIPVALNVESHVREIRFETRDYPDGVNYRVQVNITDNRGLKSVDISDEDFTIDNANGVLYDDWPEFHHYKNNTGYSPVQAPETNNTDWIYEIGREIVVSPAVFDDKVFVGDRNGSFWALDEETGALIWRYDHTDVWSWCDTSPAIGYSSFWGTYVVFFGLTITDGYNFFALDVDGLTDGDQGILEATLPPNLNINGDVLWAYRAEGSGALSSSPTVHNDIVYIGFFETSLGDDNASVYAFDINGNVDGDDGIPDDDLNPDFREEDILWTYDTESMAVTSTPAVANIPAWGDVVYIGTDEGFWTSEQSNNNFFALDADPFDDLVDQGIVDPPGATYDLLWEVNLEDYIFSSPAVAYGNVYITTYSSENYNPGNGGLLYCLNAETGATEWTFEIEPDNDFYASPAVWNDMVYIPTRTGSELIYAFDATPEDGVDEGLPDPPLSEYDTIWVHDIYADKITSSPAVANNRVYIGSGWPYSRGAMYCLNATGDGTGGTNEIWVYETSDYIYGSPSIANSHVYVTDTDGIVYRFGALNGTDLTVKHNDVTYSLPTPQDNNTAVTIYTEITNTGSLDASNVLVRIFDDVNENGQYDLGELIGEGVISLISAYDSELISIAWTATPVGYHNIYVVVDPFDTIDELKEDNNEAWSFFAVETPSADYTVDYIQIVDSPDSGGAEIPDQTVIFDFTITGWAASFNTTGGYLGDVIVSWTVDNTGSTALTNPSSGTNSTFDADTTPGTAIWKADDGAGHNDTVVFTITDYTVDYILIVDSQGPSGSEIPNQTVDVGIAMEGWAAAFNNTGGYIGNIHVTWSVNNVGTNASTDPLTGLSSEFHSGHNGGSAVWIADDGSGHQDEVSFTVNGPTLDYILIVDSQGTGVSEIQNQVVPVGFTIQGWVASFNNTIGYLQDITVSWTVVDAEGADASTTPPIGTSSTFDAGVTSGSATWIANDGFGHTHDVDFTIIPPEIDYIVIMDVPNNSGNEIQDQTVAATFTIEGWAAAFNDTVGYIQDISVAWTVSNSGSTATTNPSSGLSSTFDADINSGTATWRAEDGSGHWDTVIFNVVGLTVDSILIVNSPNTGTDEIPTQNVDVGVYITGWAAAFNDSYGYMQDISVSWSVSNTGSTAETDPPSGTSSTFYSHENGGTARWFADDGDGHTDNVTITINPPSRDYILIVDSSGSGEFEIQDMTVGVGFTIQGWAAGFNNTIGYLNDVSTTTWTVSNSGSIASTAPGVGASSTFNAQSDPGTATWTATDGPRSDSVEFTIDPPQIDNILIVDNPNTGEFEIPDQTVDVGFNTTGWAAGFNNTVGYIGDVTVTWTLNNAGTNSTTGPQTDVYSEFRSGWFGGTTIWTAEYAIGKTDTVEFTVNPPTVDYIRIVDSQGTGDQEIPNQTVDIDFRILGFAASFNDTIGYLDDINVNWTVDNIDSDASTAPSEGFSSEFFAGWQGGNSTWTADDDKGHTNSVTYTINPPQIDYILIVDNPFTGSDEIPDITIGVGQTIEGWAAGFNNIAGYIDDVNVTWSVTNFGTQASIDPLIGNHSYFTSGIIGGSAVWRAEDEIGNYDTVTFSVSEPQGDYIQIHDAPDGTGSVVIDIVYPVGHETRLFGVLMNNTAGYIDDAPANSQWTSQDPNIVTASTPGEYTELVCSITNFGIIILTIDDGNGHTNSTTITVLEPTTDDLKIMDGPGGSGEEVTNPEYPVGAEVDFYGAMFNDTAGYIGDVPSSASWRSSHPRISVDSSGSSATITCSDTDYGTATITLEDDDGNSESVLVTILEPTVDSVLVRDAPGSSGSPIANHNLDVGSSETYYAIGFNDTADNLGGVDVDWSNTNSEVGVLTVAFGSQTTFSAFSDKVGSTTILVTYDGNSVGSFVVTIKDTVDPVADAGSDQIAKVGETVFFDASDSSDNVEIEKYTWTFNHKDDQVILTGESEAFEFLVPGNYEISLEVEDSSGNTAYDSFTVVVEGEVGEDEENPWIMIISLIIIILVVLLLLMFLMTKKKKKVQRCRICGKEFYPQTDAEAAQGMCPECATKGIFGAKSSSAIGEPRPAVASTKTVVVRCPSCKEEFDFGVKGDGPQTVTCPHCGTQGEMEF